VFARVSLMVCLLTLAATAAPALAAQVYISSDERFFRIEWQLVRADPNPPAIVGSVTNRYSYPIQRVQVQAQIIDNAGRITHETVGTIGDIPPGGRGMFRLQLPADGARYVMTVHSFEFGAAQSP
jgi:hypothetical protein